MPLDTTVMTPKKIVALNSAILTVGLGIWLLSKWSSMDIIAKFGTFILLTAGAAIVAAVFVLPAAGEGVGNLFYSAPEEVEPDKYHDAASKLAQGDYDDSSGLRIRVAFLIASTAVSTSSRVL